MSRDGADVFAVPAATLTRLGSAPVAAAGNRLVAFSDQACHYSLQANSTATALPSLPGR